MIHFVVVNGINVGFRCVVKIEFVSKFFLGFLRLSLGFEFIVVALSLCSCIINSGLYDCNLNLLRKLMKLLKAADVSTGRRCQKKGHAEQRGD